MIIINSAHLAYPEIPGIVLTRAHEDCCDQVDQCVASLYKDCVYTKLDAKVYLDNITRKMQVKRQMYLEKKMEIVKSKKDEIFGASSPERFRRVIAQVLPTIAE